MVVAKKDIKEHVHFEPVAYSLVDRIFSELANFDKFDYKVLKYWFRFGEHADSLDEVIRAKKSYKSYIDLKRDDMGETLYKMMNNFYLMFDNIYENLQKRRYNGE